MANEPGQPNANPGGGDPTPPANDPNNPPKPPTPPAGNPGTFDATKLTRDQVNQVLDNPELWSNPRIKELVEAKGSLEKIQKDQQAANDQKLKDEKKWEELSTSKEKENETLRGTIKSLTVNQAASAELHKLNVVDLDGALKLLDTSKITIEENGTVTGLDDAVKTLQKDRPYMFKEGGGMPTLGTPSNPSAPTGTGQFRFKESQLTPEFYKANEQAINEAARLGLIEADGPPR